MAPARIAQKTSLPLLRVLSLPGKQRVLRAVSYQRLLYCTSLHSCYLAMGLHVTISLKCNKLH
jgi:hypothetical protein